MLTHLITYPRITWYQQLTVLALARGGLDCSRTVPHVLLCRSLTADKILINTDRPDWLHLLICCWPGSLRPWLPHPDDEYELAKLWKHFLKHCFTNWQFFSSLFIDHSFSLFDSLPTPPPPNPPTCGYWNLSTNQDHNHLVTSLPRGCLSKHNFSSPLPPCAGFKGNEVSQICRVNEYDHRISSSSALHLKCNRRMFFFLWVVGYRNTIAFSLSIRGQ